MTSWIVGREGELRDLNVFLNGVVPTPSALILGGSAGVGKSILWHHAVEEGGRQGQLILSARPAEAEASLSYSALGDLLSNKADEAIALLTDPQRHALEVALLREAPGDKPPDQRAVAVALHYVFTALSRDQAVLVAVDDVQWLDKPSARVIQYALRRLRDERVRILLAERREEPGHIPLGLDRVLPQERVMQLDVGGLNLAATRQVLTTRLGSRFSRSTIRRIHRASGGNPFFALELARGLVRAGVEPTREEPLPIPVELAKLVADRLAALPSRAQTVLVAAAALAQPRISVLDRALGESVQVALRRARDAQLIEIEGDVIEFTHPLLASVAYQISPRSTARRIHRRLAEAVSDGEERARHLALAADGPDEGVAADLEEAARVAWMRGAAESAADLCQSASRLTPPAFAPSANRRAIAAAEYWFIAGDLTTARSLLEPLVEKMPSGHGRAKASGLLGLVRYRLNDQVAAKELWEQAAREAKGDPVLEANTVATLAVLLRYAGESEAAFALGERALRLAEEGGDDLTLETVLETFAGMVMNMSIEPVGLFLELIDRAFVVRDRAMKEGGSPSPRRAIVTADSPEYLRGCALFRIGDLDEARPWFQRALKATLDLGNPTDLPRHVDALSLVEFRTGNWDQAAAYAQQEWDILAETGEELFVPPALFAQAQLAAGYGRVEETQELVDEAMRIARQGKLELVFEPYALWIRGFLELSLGDTPEALAHFQLIANSYLGGARCPELDIYSLPDAVECLIAGGDLALGAEVLGRFEEDDRWRGNPLPLAAAGRSQSLLSSARGDIEGALAHARSAVIGYEELPMPFETGRALLIQGRVLRRAKQKKAAHHSLDRALSIFDALGARLWSEQTSSELARLGLRAPAPLELTQTERRVADLSASGLTNRQVAEALFISPKTVEWNLAKVYRKLGVNSRAQLATQMTSKKALDD